MVLLPVTVPQYVVELHALHRCTACSDSAYNAILHFTLFCVAVVLTVIPWTMQALSVKDDLLVGVGLDGNEVQFRPRLYEELFAKAREDGLFTVCHAGETSGPDYMWEAIKLLKVTSL